MKRHLSVVVLTPLGQGGAGGIDRIMDSLRPLLADASGPGGAGGLDVAFLTTRGPRVWLSPLYALTAALRLLWLRLRGRCDVVHINLSSNASAWRKGALAWWADALGIPYVVHLHGSAFDKFWAAQTGLRLRIVDRLFTRAAAILLLGGVWRDLVAGRLPEAAPRIVILPNATPRRPASTTRQADPPVILFLGRLGARKGSPHLVAALGRLAGKRWEAVIAGDGDVEWTRQEIERLGLTARVQVPGWVGPGEVDALLDRAQILVLPSFEENLPMSVIEGFAARLAVVTTPVGATADILTDGDNGLFVQPGDVDGLTAALGRLLDDPALRARLATNALATHADRLELGQYAVRLCEVWRKAAG